MSKKYFLFEVKVKAKKAPVFKEGMPPGVLASHIATWDREDRFMEGSMLIGSLLSHGDAFLAENVEVNITEVDEEDRPI